MRVDKWLWTARLFKTRGLASEALTGGRVHVNGVAVKPSRDVSPGDELEVTIGPVRRTLIVRGAAERRHRRIDSRWPKVRAFRSGDGKRRGTGGFR